VIRADFAQHPSLEAAHLTKNRTHPIERVQMHLRYATLHEQEPRIGSRSLQDRSYEAPCTMRSSASWLGDVWYGDNELRKRNG
jgi:hypothetical protein